jgi:hypothetical protein
VMNTLKESIEELKYVILSSNHNWRINRML